MKFKVALFEKSFNGSAVRGRDGSAARDLHGSAARGLHSYAAKGLNGSAAGGLNGSAVRGLNGSAAKGLNGSAVRGRDGSAVRGLHGSATRGLHGSAIEGLNASAARGLNGSAAKGLNGSAAGCEARLCLAVNELKSDWAMPLVWPLAHPGQSPNQGQSPRASRAVDGGAKPRLTSGGGAVNSSGGGADKSSHSGAVPGGRDVPSRRAVQKTLRTKLLKVILLTTVLFALGIVVPAQTKAARFNPDGSFWLIGEPPTEFRDLGGINLNGRRLRRIPTQGLQLNNGKTFHYKSLIVKRDNFSFTTVSLGGVYYTFSGKFLRGGVFAEQDLFDEQPVLEGVLTRYKSGKKVAEAKLRFSYFGGT